MDRAATLRSVNRSHEVHWRIERPGASPAQVAEEFERFVDFVTATWSTHFPRREGYLTIVEPLAPRLDAAAGVALSPNAARGVRISVIRHDFRAQAEIRPEPLATGEGSSRRHPGIFFTSWAGSRRLFDAERVEARRSTALAGVKTAAGVGTFGYMLALAAGGMVQPLLAIMALFVFAVILPAGGLCAGTWTAERISAMRRGSIVAESAGDREFQRDLRRWRAATRRFGARRRALSGGPRGLPFRRTVLELEPA